MKLYYFLRTFECCKSIFERCMASSIFKIQSDKKINSWFLFSPLDLTSFRIVEPRYPDKVLANAVKHSNSSDQVSSSSTGIKPEHSERYSRKKGGTKEVRLHVEDSRRSSNSNLQSYSDLEDDEEASEQGMDLLEDTSRTPRYKGHETKQCYAAYALSFLVLKVKGQGKGPHMFYLGNSYYY